MSEPVPSGRTTTASPRYYPLPPAPPAVLKPIPFWVWIASVVVVIGLTAASVLVIRSLRAQTMSTQAAVDQLHAEMTRGDDAGILAAADATYRQAVNDQTSNSMFDNVRTRLGAPRSSRQIGREDSDEGSLGEFLTLRYRTVFDKGAGKETICFHNDNGAWKLAAYNVESPLIQGTKPALSVRPGP